MQLFISKEGTHINVLKVRMRKARMAPYRQFFVIVFLLTKVCLVQISYLFVLDVAVFFILIGRSF